MSDNGRKPRPDAAAGGLTAAADVTQLGFVPPEGDGSLVGRLAASGGGAVDRSARLGDPEADLKFAAALLASRRLTERDLARAAEDWTPFGRVSLAEHLRERGLLSGDEIEEAERLSRSVVSGSVSRTTGSSRVSGAAGLDRIRRLIRLPTEAGGGELPDDQTLPTRFRFVRKLGQGGLGTVWLAFDEQLKRHVAVKEAHDVPGASEIVDRRFRREAEITGRLEHPAIVPVYQFGRDERTGRTFYAMRFLGKQTLKEAIAEYHRRVEAGDDDPLHLRRLLRAFIGLCQAVGHAHSRGVIHRDLKPENVAVDAFGEVILMDWGLAWVVDGGRDGALSGTENDGEEGPVVGTPNFMAPEQAAGRLDEIDARTDIYGLGAVLFAILTGRAPHEVSTRVSPAGGEAPGVRDVLTAIVARPTPSAREADPRVPAALDAVCAKAMAKQPFLRYRSAAELADDVERWIAGEPTTAFREPWHRASRRWLARNPRVAQGLVASLLCSLLAVTGLLVFAGFRAEAARREAAVATLRQESVQIATRLRAVGDELAKDARFMSVLPPIQGLVDATADRETDAAEIWRQRLATIYTGLLEANPAYVTVAYARVDRAARDAPAPVGSMTRPDPELSADEEAAGDGDTPAAPQAAVTELVRVERRDRAGSRVGRVPESRLATAEWARAETLAAMPEELFGPGDVRLSIFRTDSARRGKRAGLRLRAEVPVFDELTGRPFGVTTVVVDLEATLRETLEAVVRHAAEAVVTARSGPVLDFDRTRGVRPVTASTAGDIVPGAASRPESIPEEGRVLGENAFEAVVRLGGETDGADLGLALRLP